MSAVILASLTATNCMSSCLVKCSKFCLYSTVALCDRRCLPPAMFQNSDCLKFSLKHLILGVCCFLVASAAVKDQTTLGNSKHPECGALMRTSNSQELQNIAGSKQHLSLSAMVLNKQRLKQLIRQLDMQFYSSLARVPVHSVALALASHATDHSSCSSLNCGETAADAHICSAGCIQSLLPASLIIVWACQV